MVSVFDIDGKVIHRYKNLAGLRVLVSRRWHRAYASLYLAYPGAPESVDLYHRGLGGILVITFEDNARATVDFGDYDVMLGVVQRWRNLRGLPVHCWTSNGDFKLMKWR